MFRKKNQDSHTLAENPNKHRQYNHDTLKTITLAGGCFWGTQAYMSRLLGVARTECGYANGRTDDPTYESVCTGTTGYAEVVRIQYDEEMIPLKVLLHEYFKTINPTSRNRQGGDVGSQYRTGIYYTDESDTAVIQEVIGEEQKKADRPIVTEVLPLSSFYKAEEYHQDYLEKHPNGYCHVDLSLLPQEGKNEQE